MFQNALECAWGNVEARLTGDGHQTGLPRVLELAMAAGRPDLPPSIFLDQPDHLSDLHERSRFYAPRSSRRNPTPRSDFRPPNGLRLSGARKGVRCSRGLDRSYISECSPAVAMASERASDFVELELSRDNVAVVRDHFLRAVTRPFLGLFILIDPGSVPLTLSGSRDLMPCFPVGHYDRKVNLHRAGHVGSIICHAAQSIAVRVGWVVVRLSHKRSNGLRLSGARKGVRCSRGLGRVHFIAEATSVARLPCASDGCAFRRL